MEYLIKKYVEQGVHKNKIIPLLEDIDEKGRYIGNVLKFLK